MDKLRKLPVGDSSFESIRRDNQLYVDKTEYLYRLVDEGKYYFLSRPRRFGKSLTISSLKCLFQGKKKLFDGLWIAENTDWAWEEHPVLFVDFNGIDNDTPEKLVISLEWELKEIARTHQLKLEAPFLKNQFKELILALNKKSGMPVIILIDEYDKPIIEHIGRGRERLEIAKANRDVLKSFFGVLKEGEVASVLRFVFITGVSKFSRVSIFSELNNLKDLTMRDEYADMLGYTQEELETSFAPYFPDFAQKQKISVPELLEMLKWKYNGYRFSERDVRVYNPYSILCSIDEKKFRDYWFETGTPTFLANLLKEQNYPIPDIEKLELDVQIFSVYEIERLQPEALLFQTGYITIDSVDKDGLYAFRYPNQEVKISFLKSLMFFYIPGDWYKQSTFKQLPKLLVNEDLDRFFEIITSIFASIPYTVKSNRDEGYFHTAFFLVVSASGVNAQSEVLTCDGRIDMVMEFTDKLYIIEFKCNQSAKAAILQIHKKNYAAIHRESGKKILLMGINFDAEKRNVSEWLVE